MVMSKRPPLDEWLSLFQSTIAAEGVTTGAGDAAGNSIIDAGLIGAGANSFVSMLMVLYPGQPLLVDSQDITAFNNINGEVTYSAAYKGVAAAIPAGVAYKIVTFRFVPAEIAALTTIVETSQYYDKIFYDDATGIAGTAWPVGTPQVPSDVIADVITMCGARNLRTIQVHGALALGAIMEHYNFTGYEHEDITDLLNLSGQDVDGSHISHLIVTGAQGGAGLLTIFNGIAYAVTLFNGRMEGTSFYNSTCSFRDAGFIDLVRCESIYGPVTIQVQAPTRASIKDWIGDLILTLQDGGVCNVRGFKGTLVIDEMTAGTLNVYANGADITINADCSGGTVNIYGNARVTDNSGATVVNDYTKETQLDTIEASVGRTLFSMDFWSNPVEEKIITAAQATAAVGAAVIVAGLPALAVVVRAVCMFKFRMVENTNAAENSIDCAAAMPIQVDDSGNTGWVTCIDFTDEMYKIAATSREGGDVVIGDNNVAARVDGNDTYDFQWLNAKAHLANIQFNDIQMGIRIWYSV